MPNYLCVSLKQPHYRGLPLKAETYYVMMLPIHPPILVIHMEMVEWSFHYTCIYISWLVQDSSNSSVLAMELLQLSTRPLISYMI